MKVFVATTATQGMRDDDFFYAVPGELVRLPGVECCDPNCGCGWSLAGLASSRATSTFAVVDRNDIDAATYADLFLDALTREGWVPAGGISRDGAMELAAEHAELAASFEEGSILEVRTGELRVRAVLEDVGDVP